MSMFPRRTRPALLVLLGALAGAPGIAAQTDSATVVAGPRYAAGSLHQAVLGSGYRDLWTTPIRVPVLDMAEFAGGLHPLRRGGGNQTRSLRLRGADGREYTFRSVDKHLDRGVPPELRGTVVQAVLQDLVGSLNPAAAIVADPLLDAAGVLHAASRLVVLPDSPRLGPFRQEFGGMLGLFAVHPDEGAGDQPGFAGAAKVTGTDALLEKLEDSPRDRVDARAFLTARLMDLFLGDWDRHEDQWRWARFDRDGTRWWVPVPEDRDYGFVRYGGALVSAARGITPKLVRFGPEYRDLYGLTLNAEALDRRLLSGLDWRSWDSVAVALRGRLTDSVIDAAVRRMPPAYYGREGAGLARVLRARRDRLGAEARAFYLQLASDVEVRATDRSDRATVERLPGGELEMRLYGEGKPEREPYFHRVFLPVETREVRIFLHGGDDRAAVRGTGPARIGVRLVGGGGNDLLADSTRTGKTWLYDDRGSNRLLAGARTVVDRRSSRAEKWQRGGIANPPRDWGAGGSWLVPYASWRSNVGPVIGGGPSFTRYGFRQHPYAYQLGARALWAPGHGRFGVEARGDFRRSASAAHLEASARATQLGATRFHGFGNDTPPAEDVGQVRIWEDRLELEPTLYLPVAAGMELALGAVARRISPEVPPGNVAEGRAIAGSEAFGELGLRAGLELDRRDSRVYPHRGAYLRLGGIGTPLVSGAPEPYLHAEAEGTTYATLPGSALTLAFRGGAERVWGGFPLQEAAFLGGSGSLRGYATERFAGDASLWENAEVRAPLTHARLILPGELGALLLADAGRVYLNGDSPGGWHTSAGVGLWFRVLNGERIASATYARGDQHRVYLKLALPF